MKYRKSFSARLRGTFAFFLVCAFMLAPLSVSAKTAPVREDLRVSSRILDLFRDKESANISTRYLCPGGQAFGMKIRQDGVTVSAITDTSSALGKLVKVGDILLSFNGETIESATDFGCAFLFAQNMLVIKITLSFAGILVFQYQSIVVHFEQSHTAPTMS